MSISKFRNSVWNQLYCPAIVSVGLDRSNSVCLLECVEVIDRLFSLLRFAHVSVSPSYLHSVDSRSSFAFWETWTVATAQILGACLPSKFERQLIPNYSERVCQRCCKLDALQLPVPQQLQG
jgi:hypothetical protein